MKRPRCLTSWDGHHCARPPGHPAPCMCWCGERDHGTLQPAATSPCQFAQRGLQRDGRTLTRT